MIKGIFRKYNPAGTFLLPLNIFVIVVLISMVILLILHIWFNHVDTILVVLLFFFNLILYIKLHY